MSSHSYSRCWIHLTWATLRREPILPKSAGVEVSGFLTDYAKGKGIYMAINYVNPEHTHALIDLPTSYSVEDVTKLLKGASSQSINKNRIIGSRFRWGRATEPSQYLTLSSTPLHGTLRIKNSITAREPSSTSTLS